jgi:hypothetical protein
MNLVIRDREFVVRTWSNLQILSFVSCEPSAIDQWFHTKRAHKKKKNENMNTSLTHVCTCLGVKWNVDNCLEKFLISILLFNTDIWWLTVRKRSRWCKRTNSLNRWSISSRGNSVDGHVLDCVNNSAVNWSILFCNNNK